MLFHSRLASSRPSEPPGHNVALVRFGGSSEDVGKFFVTVEEEERAEGRLVDAMPLMRPY